MGERGARVLKDYAEVIEELEKMKISLNTGKCNWSNLL